MEGRVPPHQSQENHQSVRVVSHLRTHARTGSSCLACKKPCWIFGHLIPTTGCGARPCSRSVSPVEACAFCTSSHPTITRASATGETRASPVWAIFGFRIHTPTQPPLPPSLPRSRLVPPATAAGSSIATPPATSGSSLSSWSSDPSRNRLSTDSGSPLRHRRMGAGPPQIVATTGHLLRCPRTVLRRGLLRRTSFRFARLNHLIRWVDVTVQKSRSTKAKKPNAEAGGRVGEGGGGGTGRSNRDERQTPDGKSSSGARSRREVVAQPNGRKFQQGRKRT